MEMYRKLNYLVSNLSPDYTDSGYMAGPLVQLTMGGWCYELPGFINSITLDVPQESPWEIGIPNLDREAQTIGGISYRNPSVKEMPHIVKVTGLTFTPIHTFIPQRSVTKSPFILPTHEGLRKNQKWFNFGAADNHLKATIEHQVHNIK